MPRSGALALRLVRQACKCFLACGLCLGSDLAQLASLDGAPGDEGRVIRLIQGRIGGRQQVGINGSLVAVFGQGAPRTLLVAGVDEPGYVVSGIHEEGYLRVHALANAPFGTGLATHFVGQPVRVSTRSGRLLPGVVAAPSVHFGSAATFPRGASSADVFVDIGARSGREVDLAGVAALDRLTLEKVASPLGEDWLAAPWISSRSGAAILASLARRFENEIPQGTVTLAFVAQQYPHNAGLSRVLQSVAADRVVVIFPNGGETSSIAEISGSNSELVREILGLAGQIDVRLRRDPTKVIPFGPFGDSRPWKAGLKMAALSPAVRNRSTPAEAVSLGEMERLSTLLAVLVGLDRRGPDPKTASGPPHRSPRSDTDPVRGESALEGLVRTLVAVPGVSGSEDPVRDLIQNLLPRPVLSAARVDDAGNLIVRLGNPGTPSAAFIAHMDEIGFTVRSISANGSVSADPRGGGTPSLFAWRPVAVHGGHGSLAAVMSRSGTLDFGGVTGREIREMGVQAGDAVTVQKRYRRLLGSRISARSLDDRLGCAVLLEAIRRLVRRSRHTAGAVDFVFTVEEETGLKGARRFAEEAAPVRVYPIDTFVTSDSPLESRRIAYAPLGAGPVLRAVDESGMTPRAELARVIKLARRHRVPVQLGVTAGGNDGSVFRSTGTANIPIGFPLRYAHTPVETADLRDAEAAATLIELLAIEELRGRE